MPSRELIIAAEVGLLYMTENAGKRPHPAGS